MIRAEDCLVDNGPLQVFNHYTTANHLPVAAVARLAGLAIGFMTGELSADTLQSLLRGSLDPQDLAIVLHAYKEHPRAWKT